MNKKWIEGIVTVVVVFGSMYCFARINAIHYPRIWLFASIASGLMFVIGGLIALGQLLPVRLRAFVVLGLLTISFFLQWEAISQLPNFGDGEETLACYNTGTQEVYSWKNPTRKVVENPFLPSKITCLEKDFAVAGYIGSTYYLAEFEASWFGPRDLASMVVLFDKFQRTYRFSSTCPTDTYNCPFDQVRFRDVEKQFFESADDKARALYEKILKCAGDVADYYPPEAKAVQLSKIALPEPALPLSWLAKRQIEFSPKTVKQCDFSEYNLRWKSLQIHR